MCRQTLRCMLFGLLLVTVSAAALTGCAGATAAGQTKAPQATATTSPDAKLLFGGGASLARPYPFAEISFTDLTLSHAASIATVTDLGVMLHAPCTAPGAPWQPAETTDVPVSSPALPDVWVVGPVSQFLDFSLGDPLAPGDWLHKLAALPMVTQVHDATVFCPLIPLSGFTPGAGAYLDPATWKTPTYLHVTFAPTLGYAQAVATISDLGFRLADPCYEQTKPTPAWHAMGQKQSYAASNSLTLALTDANATLWRQQLAKMAGVSGFSVLAGKGCAG